MRKLLLAFFSLPLLTFGQGSQDFEGVTNLTIGYASGSFTSGGIAWSYSESRDQDTFYINGNGIMLRRASDSYLEWTIPNGIGNLSFDYRKAFQGGNDRQLEVLVNGTQVATTAVFGSGSTYQGTVYSFSNAINNAGNTVIRIKNVGTTTGNRQLIIDNVSWTAFATPATNCGITTADLTAITCNDAGTSTNPADDFVTFSLNPTGSYLGSNGYTVSVPTGTITPATGVYGAATTFTLQGGSAGAGDVVVTLTDADSTSCSLNVTVTDPGSCSSATPVITVTPATLSAFDHYVGTPSASQTFTVSGITLDDDITLVASTGVEISSDNTTFSSSITLTQIANTVATTTLYVRANAATAGAFTGNVVATSLNATNDTLTISGTASVFVPVITVTPATLTAFDHFVGTPSTSQTFTAAGNALSADIILTASTGVEISSDNTTFSSSITLTPTANTVATTTLYVRGNSAVYGAFTGNVIATSTGADNDTLVISGFANDYVPYTIDQINGVNANGVGDSVNVFVRLHGVVHCMDFRANAGYNFIIIDETGEGLYVFSNTDVNGYTTPMAGDSLEIKGKIDQFNGLLQVVPTQITVLDQGVATIDPVVVTTLDEASESQYITLENVTFVTPIATFPTTNTNIDVTNGTNTFQIRILTSTDLAGAPAPQGTFNVTGIGSQFDSSNPFTSGYQLLPCGTSAFEVVCTGSNLPNVATTTSGKTITATATGMTYQWINCTTDTPISGATSRTYTATTPGSYAVIVSNANCSDTSACVVLDDASIEGVDFGKTIVAYPNPVNDQLTIQNFNSNTVIFNVTDINGKVITENVTLTSVSVLNTSSWNKGIYFVNFTGVNKEAHTLRIVK